MANWRVDIDISFEIDSDEIEDWEFFLANRNGPKADLLTERVFLDSFIGRNRIDAMLQFDLLRRSLGVDSQWTINGTNVKSGSDGELVLPSEFRSDAVFLADADIGRVIRIGPGQTPPATRGHYLITSRNGPNSVNVDGVLPIAGDGLDFEINENDAEFLATLLSKP